MPGSLIPGDLEKIVAHTGRGATDAWVKQHFLTSEGGKVAGRIPHDGEMVTVVFSVPTIVPAQQEDGSCVFLDTQGRCTIHEVAPFGCAYHDTHMNAAIGHERSIYAIRQQVEAHQQGTAYSKWCEVLAAAGSVAPPLQQRRSAFQAMLAEIEGGQARGS